MCNLVTWSKDLQMLFNLDKCEVIHQGHNNPDADYFMDATTLVQKVSEEKDLGVIVSKDLKWDKQCVSAVHLRKLIVFLE